MVIYITTILQWVTVVITVVAIITDTFAFNCFTVISRGRSKRDRASERERENQASYSKTGRGPRESMHYAG